MIINILEITNVKLIKVINKPIKENINDVFVIF